MSRYTVNDMKNIPKFIELTTTIDFRVIIKVYFLHFHFLKPNFNGDLDYSLFELSYDVEDIINGVSHRFTVKNFSVLLAALNRLLELGVLSEVSHE